jgi:hypothetical protein
LQPVNNFKNDGKSLVLKVIISASMQIGSLLREVKRASPRTIYWPHYCFIVMINKWLNALRKVEVYGCTQITNWSNQPRGYSTIYVYQSTDQRYFCLKVNEKLQLLWSAMMMANGAHEAEITSHNFLAHSEFPQGMLSYPS